MRMDENRVQGEMLVVDAAVPIEGRHCWGFWRSRNMAPRERQMNVRKWPKETGRNGQNPHWAGREVMAGRLWGCSLGVEHRSAIGRLRVGGLIDWIDSGAEEEKSRAAPFWLGLALVLRFGA